MTTEISICCHNGSSISSSDTKKIVHIKPCIMHKPNSSDIAFTPVAEAPNMTFQIGEIISARYEVVASVGLGAVGHVYSCRDKLLGGLFVAIKFIPISRSIDKTNECRIGREIISGHLVDHQNVVKLYDVFRTENYIGLVMEYVTGTTLSSFLTMGGKFSTEEILVILKPICSGLVAIHKKGLVHRDLKPSNVLVSQGGEVKITDLGLSIPRELGLLPSSHEIEALQQDTRATATGTLVGTPAYLAPEYIKNGKFDHQVDIYAVGVIGYELVYGTTPFEGLPTNEFLKMRASMEVPFPDHIDPEFKAWLRKALACEPKERFQTAQELLSELSSLQHKLTVAKREKNIELIIGRKVNYLEMAKNLDKSHNKIKFSLKGIFSLVYAESTLLQSLRKFFTKTPRIQESSRSRPIFLLCICLTLIILLFISDVLNFSLDENFQTQAIQEQNTKNKKNYRVIEPYSLKAKKLKEK